MPWGYHGLASGFLAGFLLAVSLLNFLAFFIVRQRTLPIFAGASAMGLLFFADPGESALFAWLFVAATAYFTVEFLRLHEYDAVLGNALLSLAVLGASFPLSTRFDGASTALVLSAWAIIALTNAGIIAAGIRALGRGYPGARFFVVGSIGGLIGLYGYDFFGLGFAWEAMWITIALADRINATAGDSQLSSRIANAELQVLAELDPLTGVPNRRAFDDRLNAEWERALLTGTPVGVIMIDVDHFKEYNDRFGHVAGDLCLSKIAQACAGALKRGGDFFARYGGEEFAAILATQNDDSLVLIAERMRESVAAEAMAHPGQPEGIVTISLGTARMKPALDATPTTLVAAADDALYEAKSRGRNCVRATSFAPG
jgi:diguanylate cyclase (GGDEF)-like protein